MIEVEYDCSQMDLKEALQNTFKLLWKANHGFIQRQQLKALENHLIMLSEEPRDRIKLGKRSMNKTLALTMPVKTIDTFSEDRMSIESC